MEDKKKLQISINNICENIYYDVCDEVDITLRVFPLNKCKAFIFETENYYGLKSYDSFVAAIDKTTGDFYDFLRLSYGYTATSCLHIAKFKNKYANRIRKEYRWSK